MTINIWFYRELITHREHHGLVLFLFRGGSCCFSLKFSVLCFVVWYFAVFIVLYSMLEMSLDCTYLTMLIVHSVFFTFICCFQNWFRNKYSLYTSEGQSTMDNRETIEFAYTRHRTKKNNLKNEKQN